MTMPQFCVYRFDLTTSKTELLIADAAQPAISPDGTLIAYSKKSNTPEHGNTGDLYVYNIVTKQNTLLLAGSAASVESSPSWSPAGDKLVYNSQHGSIIDIKVIDIHTKNTSNVFKDNTYRCYEPKWAPAGNKIVYYQEKGDNHDQVYLTDETGSFFMNLTNDSTVHNYYCSWINKDQVLFTDQTKGGLWLVSQTGKKIKMEGIPANVFYSKYSEAAHTIAYLTQRPESNFILYDTVNKTSRQIKIEVD